MFHQKNSGRLAGAVAVATVLSLAGPARAGAATMSGPVNLWAWLQDLWLARPVVSVRHRQDAAGPVSRMVLKDACTNPAGCPPPTTPPPTTTPPPNPGNEQGVGTDPDGKP